MIASWMYSKSCQERMNVVSAIPTPANAKPISTAPAARAAPTTSRPAPSRP